MDLFGEDISMNGDISNHQYESYHSGQVPWYTGMVIHPIIVIPTSWDPTFHHFYGDHSGDHPNHEGTSKMI